MYSAKIFKAVKVILAAMAFGGIIIAVAFPSIGNAVRAAEMLLVLTVYNTVMEANK